MSIRSKTFWLEESFTQPRPSGHAIRCEIVPQTTGFLKFMAL